METGNWLFYAVLGLAVAVVLLTSLIKNAEWSPKTKNLIATVLSVVGAGVLVLLSPDRSVNDAGDFFALATAAYGTSQALYNFILRGTPIENKLAKKRVVKSKPRTTTQPVDDPATGEPYAGPTEAELFPEGPPKRGRK